MGVMDNADLFNRTNPLAGQSHVCGARLLYDDLSGQSNFFIRRPFHDGDCQLRSAVFNRVRYIGEATATECKQAWPTACSKKC